MKRIMNTETSWENLVRNVYFGDRKGEGRTRSNLIVKTGGAYETGSALCFGTSVAEPSVLLH
jgi:hypothetical protein